MLIKIIPFFHAGTLRRPIGLGFQLIVRIQFLHSPSHLILMKLVTRLHLLLLPLLKNISRSALAVININRYHIGLTSVTPQLLLEIKPAIEKSTLLRDNIQYRYNICKAHVKRTILTSKHRWRRFCATLNHRTKLSRLWNTVKKIGSTFSHLPIPVLKALAQNLLIVFLKPIA